MTQHQRADEFSLLESRSLIGKLLVTCALRTLGWKKGEENKEERGKEVRKKKRLSPPLDPAMSHGISLGSSVGGVHPARASVVDATPGLKILLSLSTFQVWGGLSHSRREAVLICMSPLQHRLFHGAAAVF